MNIVVAGASGYIGRGLIPLLRAQYPTAQITALSRGERRSEDPAIHWKSCDLFSLKSLESCLPPKVDLAYYLVHSMGPTAQLDQGSFADYDLILADNFARVLRRNGVGQLIYLGGLLPEDENLSPHLRSRWEVEETFRSHHLPMTVFRAGIIIGEEGSSTQIILKLVARLVVMICPAWTQTLTSPVDLETVHRALVEATLDGRHLGKVYDLAGCRPLSYLEMMKETAKKVGRKRMFLTVPVFSPWLSRLWVSVVTNSPRPLVYPLIQSLRHPMVARPDHAFPSARPSRSYAEMIKDVPLRIHPRGTIFPFRSIGKTVRSVQRLPLPRGKNAEWVRTKYMEWIPTLPGRRLKVKVDGKRITFSAFLFKQPLLVVELSEERSTPDRQLLYVTGGLLNKKDGGRLEFREVLNGSAIIAAVHNFSPALPWVIYKYTQALVHLLIMKRFGKWLARNG